MKESGRERRSMTEETAASIRSEIERWERAKKQNPGSGLEPAIDDLLRRLKEQLEKYEQAKSKRS